MNILLVYPACPRSYWSFHYALKFISKRAAYPPLGLVTIAAMLPADWPKKLVDMNVTHLNDCDILWADYVLISAMDIQRESVLDVVGRCRTLGTKTVAGGPLFSCSHEEFPDIDHILLNEGELTIPRFLADLEQGTPKHIYEAPGWADIRETPVPLWALIDRKRYASMNIQYSRGCPYDCEFCSVTALFGHVPRCKSSHQIIRELDALYATGWRGSVFFVDDNFIGNKKKLKEDVLPALVDWMERKGRPFSFSTEASINLADDEQLISLMVRAGFTSVFIGIETTNEQSLIECNKMQNHHRDLLASVNKIQACGLEVQGGFIVGFDHDNASVFSGIADFIQKSGIISAMVGLLNAPKGTRLYKRLAQEDRLIADYTGDNTGLTMNFVPKMDHDRLLEGYRSIIDAVYSPRQFYARVRAFLRRYRPAKASGHLQLHHIIAGIRSVFRLGIIGKERLYYWRVVLWSLFTHPRMLPFTIRCAIYGHHYNRVYRDYNRGPLSGNI